MARLRFRTKVFLLYTLFVAVVITALAYLLFRPEERRLLRAQEESLATEARQVASITPIGAAGPEWTPAMQSLARIARVRLTLVAPDGRVLGDTQYDPGSMANHANRPEIRQALRGRVGHSLRYSQTLRVGLLYSAVPLSVDGRIAGVVRVAKAQREVAALLARLRRTFVYGALVAAIFAAAFGALIIARITAPLQALEQAARRLGAGDLSARVRLFGQDELGLLARAFNRMAGQVESLVANLSEERSRMLTILATLEDGVIFLDRRARVVLANRAAADFLGLAPDKMAGCTPVELLLPPAAVELVDQAVKSRSGAEGEFELHLPARRRLAATLTPIRDADRELYGTLVVLRDLTALRRLERVRQDFVANVSHELRTPLAAVKALAETLLQEGLAPEDRARFLSTINAECDRLNALVDDLLTLARLDSGTAKPRAEVFSLPELAAETIQRLFPLEAPRRPQLSLPADLPPVKADPDQIRQVLINLLDNAAKYSPPEASFGLRAAHEGDWVTVTVWDEGPGIPEAERERIFERFYRLDKARSRASGGTGLGLSIVKHLVEGYGGRVWVENRGGAEFSFTIPRAGVN